MNVLVHACCGPCSIMPTRLLREQGHDIAVFFANSNIAPVEEYERRLVELQKFGVSEGFEVTEGTYDPDAWEREVAPIGESLKEFSPAFGQEFAVRLADGKSGAGEKAGDAGSGMALAGDATSGVAQPGGIATLRRAAAACDESQGNGAAIRDATQTGGMVVSVASVAELLDDERRKERCRACYRMRLEEAAREAAAGGFDALATTLAVSPYQFSDVISEELSRAAEQAGVKALFEDYRSYYDEATRISRELGMYRQNYCGCRYSVREAEATRAFVKAARKARKKARKAQQ